MNFQRRAPSRRRDIYLNLTSMIDVMFNLLVFFFAASSLALPESYLQSTLQARGGGGGQAATGDLSPQVLEVRRGPGDVGVYRLGERVVGDRAALLDLLRALPKDPGVVVQVQDDVTVALAVGAMQACRDAGFEKVTYVPASR